MKEETINELLQKYKAAKTTFEEEEYLKNNSNLIEKQHSDVFEYINKHKITAPSDFNELQWKAFNLKQKQQQINRYSVLSVAASVLIIIGLIIFNFNGQKMNLAEKEALLQEAKSMIESDSYTEKNILYEDDLVIIFTQN